MRNFILNLHLYGALVGGLFIVVIAVSGSIITFQLELDHLLNPKLFKIEPQGTVLTLSAIQESLLKSDPEKKFYRFGFPLAADQPYTAQFRSTQIFINSYTGEIIGSRETPTALDKIRQLHTTLWLGVTGRNIVTVATFLSIFLVLSGIYLWWPVRNTGVSRGISFYLHYALGIYFALFLLALGVSGLVIKFDETIGPWVYATTHSHPPPYSVDSTIIPGKTPLTLTEAVDFASARLPGTTPTSITIPGPKGSYAITLKYPGHGSESRILVDQYSGVILSVQDSHSSSTGFKIMSDNGTLHTGRIFGLPSQVVMSLSSLVLAMQTVTGYIIWWKKLRRKPQLSVST